MSWSDRLRYAPFAQYVLRFDQSSWDMQCLDLLGLFLKMENIWLKRKYQVKFPQMAGKKQ